MEKRFILAFLVGVLSFSLFSCKDDDDAYELPAFELKGESVSFTENGGKMEVEVLSNKLWTAETNVDWCRISPASGEGKITCTIKADSSYLYQEREAEIVFTYGSKIQTLKVSQLGYQKQIKVLSEDLSLEYYKPYSEAYEDIEILSNVKYAISIPEEASEWLSYEKVETDPYPIPRTTKVRFTYKINSDPSTRSAAVRFESEEEGVEAAVLNILQGAAPKIVPSRAGDSLAILAISRKLNTYSNWDPNRSMVFWEGVEMDEVEYVNENNETVTEERVTGVQFFLFETDETPPFEIQYLTAAKVIIFQGNGNSHLKSIELGPEITYLPNLKSLSINGYGLVSLPEEMKNMTSLEELSLAGNNILELPVEIFASIPNLKMIHISGNRRTELSDLSQGDVSVCGMHGLLTSEIFERMPDLEYLCLSYNYFEGSLPELPVGSMPKLEYLALNLNRFTGSLPDWILKHPNLVCWNPDILVFNQEGKDSKGRRAGFDNVPLFFENPECPLWDYGTGDDEDELRAIWEGKSKLSLKGNWRYNR